MKILKGWVLKVLVNQQNKKYKIYLKIKNY